MRFRDQIVFITGAARGQGRAHALAFAREGAHLVLCDTTRHYTSVPYPLSAPEKLAQIAAEIEAMNRRTIAIDADVTDLKAIQQLAAPAQEQLGPIDVAIANVGLYSFGLTWQLSEEQWDETVSVDLKGVWVTCKAVIRKCFHDAGERFSVLAR